MNDPTTSTPNTTTEHFHPKPLTKPRRKPRTRQLAFDSMSGVYPKRTHGLGLWGNEREVFSVRVDNRLAKQFTLASKALFGSTCSAVESYMAAVVGWWQNPQLARVYPSLTIGEIKIERNLRERRKVEIVERESSETVYSRMDRNLARLKAASKDSKPVFKPMPKLSELGLEDLQRVYDRCGPGGRKMLLAAELKRRGVLQ